MTKFLSLEGLKTLIAKLKSYFAAKGEAIKNITGSGNKTLSFTRADGSTGTINYQDTTYSTGNTSTAGLTKLYTSIGGQTDGAPTNKLLSDTRTELINKITSSINAIDRTLFVVVSSLPTKPATGNENKIHLVAMTTSKGTTQKYNEYIYTNGAWEELGSFKAEVDLENYYTIDDCDTTINEACKRAKEEAIAEAPGEDDCYHGKVTSTSSISTDASYKGYVLSLETNTLQEVVKGGSPAALSPITLHGTFLFADDDTGDLYIVDTGKSSTKLYTPIATSEINALF